MLRALGRIDAFAGCTSENNRERKRQRTFVTEVVRRDLQFTVNMFLPHKFLSSSVLITVLFILRRTISVKFDFIPMPFASISLYTRSALRSAGDSKPSEDAIALEIALAGSLKVLKNPRVSQTLNHRDLLLAMNALGQIARGWDWLGQGEATFSLTDLNIFAVKLCELANLELGLLDVQCHGKMADSFVTRDLALMLLAQVRIARRLRSASQEAVLPTFTKVLCQRLQRAAEQWNLVEDLSNEDLKRGNAEANASLSAASLMLMHCAKVADVHSANGPDANPAPSIPLAVIVAWSRSALNLGLEVGPDSYKALAATTAMAMQQLSACDAELLEMKSALQGMLEFTIGRGDAGTSQKDMSHLENWHLDSCLQALAVLDTLDEKLHPGVKDPSRLYLETAVLVEVSSPTRLPKLKENHVVFWQRLLDPLLSHSLATRLAFQLEEVLSQEKLPKIPRAVRTALRDFLSCVENKDWLRQVGTHSAHTHKLLALSR